MRACFRRPQSGQLTKQFVFLLLRSITAQMPSYQRRPGWIARGKSVLSIVLTKDDMHELPGRLKQIAVNLRYAFSNALLFLRRERTFRAETMVEHVDADLSSNRSGIAALPDPGSVILRSMAFAPEFSVIHSIH